MRAARHGARAGSADAVVPRFAAGAAGLLLGQRHRLAGGRLDRRVAMCLLVLCLCWHSQLGVQVVIEDYVHHAGAETGRAAAGLPRPACVACGSRRVAVLRIAFTPPPDFAGARR